jgi:hypothetical protein
MTRDERLRRVAILCCACIRNIAYFRAGWNGKQISFPRNSNILRTINGNFLDMAVLEWCKLFSSKEEHGWKKIVTDEAEFEAGFLAAVGVSHLEFTNYYMSMRAYRDKFLAHLDSDRIMNIPFLDPALVSVKFYYEFLLNYEINARNFEYEPVDIQSYYDACHRESKIFYTQQRS